MGPSDMEPSPKFYVFFFFFQLHDPTIFFFFLLQLVSMNLLSFISKRVLIDTATLINYSRSKPV